MNPLDTLLLGIAPEHAPALVAALVTVVLLRATRWLTPAPSAVEAWAAALLAMTGAVHLALPLGHHGGALAAIGFVVSGVAYTWLGWRTRSGRRWRLPASLLVVATLAGYLVAVGGGEEPDQVGIATALVELTVLGLALVPPATPVRRRRLARFAGSTATVAVTFLVGAAFWMAAFVAHNRVQPVPAGDNHDHWHAHAGRAQAGMLVRPPGAAHHPTAEQQRAADALAAQTRAATERYLDLDVALADGYQHSFKATGTDVHLDHPLHKIDGRTLDPNRPEQLVYAIEGGRATLLGVVYVVETAGRPGPEPGGPITRWHAHNACVALAPIGLGVVSPYGNCPAFSLAIGTPEMMHVWTVENPGGPFAEGLDAAWVRAYHAEHGRHVK